MKVCLVQNTSWTHVDLYVWLSLSILRNSCRILYSMEIMINKNTSIDEVGFGCICKLLTYIYTLRLSHIHWMWGEGFKGLMPMATFVEYNFLNFIFLVYFSHFLLRPIRNFNKENQEQNNIFVDIFAHNNNNIPDLYSALFKHVQKRCTSNIKYKIQNKNTIQYEWINK